MASGDSKLPKDPTPHTIGQIGMVDRFSSLPDDILLHILQFSPMRDAVATGLLSLRWRNLWKSLNTFKFDPLNKFSVFNQDYKANELEVKRSYRRSYAEWVDGVLQQLQQLQDLHELWICSYFQDNNSPYFDRWLSFASERNVRILNINRVDREGFHIIKQGPEFPFPHFTKSKASTLVKLHLGHLEVCSPGFNHFTSLTALTLAGVTLTDAMAETALSSCSLLEYLHIWVASKLVNLKFVGNSSLRLLKHLGLYNCHDLTNVEIDAPNLESFNYSGIKTRNFAFVSVPKLVKARFGASPNHVSYRGINVTRYAFSQLETIGAQLESLMLETNTMEVKEMSPLLCPTFLSLKVLILFIRVDDTTEHIGVPWFLKACPILTKFELHINQWPGSKIELESEEVSRASVSPHRYLKEIEVSGFHGQPYHIKLVEYLVKTAVSLEKLRIVTYQKFLANNSNEVKPNKCKGKQNAREIAMQLCRELLLTAQVSVL